MNKKFSTLIAGVAMMLFAAFTVNAQMTEDKNAYQFLKIDGGDYYVSLHPTKTDSVIAVQIDDVNGADKATVDAALWKVVKNGVTQDGTQLWKITSKSGLVLSFAANDKKVMTIADGVSSWVNTNNKLYAYYSSKAIVLDLITDPNDGTKMALAQTGTLADGSTFQSGAFGLTPKTLKASELGGGFTVFTITFDSNLTGDVFAGKELIATDLTTDPGYVAVQEVGKETLNNKPLYFGLDTTRNKITPQANIYGSVFKQDTTYVADDYHSVGNENLQKLKFVMDLLTDKVTLYVKDAYDFDEKDLSSEVEAAPVIKAVYAEVLTSRVLTVSQDDQGKAVTIKLGKGTPATLPNGTGAYFIQVYDAADKVWKYAYSSISAPYFETSKTAPSKLLPAGQFYIVEKDSKYAIADRLYNLLYTNGTMNDETSLVTYRQLYAVTGQEGVYRIDGDANGNMFKFTYLDDVAAGPGEYHYLGYKRYSDSEIANEAFTLNLVSGTSGVADVYSYVDSKKYLIVKAQTTAEDAAKFKIDKNRSFDGIVYTDNIHAKGVGALALGDTLARTGYVLYQQYTGNYVGTDPEAADKALLVNSSVTPRIFSFINNGKDGQYLMQTQLGTIVVLDVNTGQLNLVNPINKPNYFDLLAAPAPDYAAIKAPGHFNVISAEDDGKMLSMNPNTHFAEIKFPGQSTLKADAYIDSMFGLWIDTASLKDAARPTYYITTQNGLSNDDKAAGIKFFLVNPFTIFAEQGEDFEWSDNPYVFGEGGVRAIFAKGITDGDDTLKIFKADNIAEKDMSFKNMSINPGAMAFATTANNTLKIENIGGYYCEDCEEYHTDPFYLSVANNVLVWLDGDYYDADPYYRGHEFTVAATTVFPTDNENVAGFAVYAAEGTVTVQGAAGQVVTIVNVLGQTVATKTLASDYDTIAAPAGVVFVTVGGETVKAVVK